MILVRWGRWLRGATLPGLVAAVGAVSGVAPAAAPSGTAQPPAAQWSGVMPASTAGLPPGAAVPSGCLASGDGYLRARVDGAVVAHIDWPNAGTRCAGEPKSTPPGVRLSFQRSSRSASDLLFVFGLSGIREGRPAREAAANLTVIAHGTIFGTLGDSRCTVDALKQTRVGRSRLYRVEARGFCTQPAHAVRGEGAVLVSTFEFAGPVDYATANDDAGPTAAQAN